MSDPFMSGGYPALYFAADTASNAAQRRYLRSVRIRLGSLLLGAVAAAVCFSLSLGPVGGAIAIAAFAFAILADLFVAIDRSDRRWYEGRAAAESAKTLTWRYVVRGGSFAAGSGADDLFLAAMKSILVDLGDIQSVPAGDAPFQISSEMRTLRAADFATRRSAYRAGRIDNQREWYANKARWNEARRTRWLVGILAAEGVGIAAGIAVVLGGTEIDLLGLIAAIAATGTAWVQAKQYGGLATAYAIAAHELASISSEVDTVPETRWAAFVGNAEEAISREHTLWRASRGLSLRAAR